MGPENKNEMAVSTNQHEFKSPSKFDISVPPGHILVNKKWKGTSLLRELSDIFTGVRTDDLGPVDFICAGSLAIMYISEADLVSGLVYENKIKTFCESKTNIIVFADRNITTIEQFSKLQDFVVLQLKVTLFPIGNVMELPQILSQLSYVHSSRTPSNSFKEKVISSQNEQLLSVLLNIPGLGRLKAEKLINHFGTLQKITASSKEQISRVVGLAAAKQVSSFLNDRIIA